MTGDSNHDEDALNFDDEEFILEDEDFEDFLETVDETPGSAAAAFGSNQAQDQGAEAPDPGDSETGQPEAKSEVPVDWSKTSADTVQSAGVDEDSDNLLFEPMAPEFGIEASGHEHFTPNEGETFAEDGSWKGRDLTPDQMGLPETEGLHVPHFEIDAGLVDEEPDDQDLQLIGDGEDFDSEPHANETVTAVTDDATGESDAGPSEDFAAASAANFEIEAGADELPDDGEFVVEDEEEQEQPAVGVGQAYGEVSFGSDDESDAAAGEEGDDWEGEGDFGNEELIDDDPIYGDAADDDGAEELEEAYAETDYDSYEESYIDEEPAHKVIGGAQGKRGFPWGALTSAAAAVLVVAAGAVVFVRPEWFGLQAERVQVARVEIKRPTVDLDLEVPAIADSVLAQARAAIVPVILIDPTGKEPGEKDPEVIVVVPLQPDPGNTVADPNPGATGPDKGPDVVVSAPVEPVEDPEPEFEIMTVRCGDLVISNQPVDDIGKMVHNLKLGTRAFAQLKNDSFFIGRIKQADASTITLNLASGDVTFAIVDLRTLSPMATTTELDFEVTETARGYVRLTNHARLFGSILTSSSSDKIILRTKDSRIALPAWSVAEKGVSVPGGVSISNDEDGSWLKDRVEDERLHGGQKTPANPNVAAPAKGR